MAFNPDEYLAAKPAKSEFDPDAYLAEEPPQVGFDPDAYLGGKPAPKPEGDSYWSRLARAPGKFVEGTKFGAEEYYTGTKEGSLMDIGVAPTPLQMAREATHRETYEKGMSPAEKEFSAKLTGLRETAKTKGDVAKVWEQPEYIVEPTYSPNTLKINADLYAKHQEGIKTRLKELGLDDTPANRKKARDADESAASSAGRQVVKEVFKQAGTNPEAFARTMGELLPGVGTPMALAWGAGAITKSPKLGASLMFLSMQPSDVRHRFTGIMQKELQKRDLKSTIEGYNELYKDTDFVNSALRLAAGAGTASSATMSVLPIGGALVGNIPRRAALREAETVATEKALSRTAAEKAATSGRMGEEAAVKAELRAAGVKPDVSPFEYRAALDAAQKGQGVRQRVLPAVGAAAANLSAPVAGQLAANAITGDETTAGDLAQMMVEQGPFALLEARALTRAFRPVTARGDYVPTEEQYSRDIAQQWADADKAKNDASKEGHIDAAVQMEADRYQHTGEKASDREHLRESLKTNMENAEAFYREQLNAELAKPKEKQDIKRVEDLIAKIQFTHQKQTLVSDHPDSPELTVEEWTEFQGRMNEADNISDPTESAKAKQQIQSDFEKLFKERRDAKAAQNNIAGVEPNEAGQFALALAGEGAPESARGEEAAAPGAEGTEAGGLGDALAGTERPDVGEAPARGPLKPEEITDQVLNAAFRVIRGRKTSPAEIYELADKFGVKYDPQEEISDVFTRVSEKVGALRDALDAERGMGDVLSRRGGTPGAVEHAVAENIGNAYKHEWGVEIETARSAEELRQKSGLNVADDVRGVYDPKTGKVWVNSAVHADAAAVKSTIFHETLGHYGLDRKFGGELDSLMRDLYAKNEDIKRAVEEWRNTKISEKETNADTYAHLDEPTRLAREVEEVLAERSESGKVKTGAFRQLIALVRKYIRMIPKVGDRMKYSDNDILHILRDAHEYASKGKGELKLNTEGQPRFSFHGEKAAKLTPQEEQRLRDAEHMESRGASPDTIRNLTGWIRNPIDGQWRRELSDSKSRVLHEPTDFGIDHPIRLGDLFDHPELYAKYPELKNVEVRRKDLGDTLGVAFPAPKEVPSFGEIAFSKNIRSMADLRKTLLHEVQHLVQDKEGWGSGGAVESLADTLRMDDRKKLGASLADSLERSMKHEWPDTARFNELKDPAFLADLANGDKRAVQKVIDAYKNDQIPDTVREDLFDAYHRLSGEIESRLVESRADMSPEELKRRPVNVGKEFQRAYSSVDNTHPSAAQKVTFPAPEPIPTTPEATVRYSKKKLNDLKDAAQQMPAFNVSMYDALRNRVGVLAGKAAARNLIHFLDTAKVAEIYGHKIHAVREIHEITGEQAAQTHMAVLEIQKKFNDWARTLKELNKKDPTFDLHEFNDVALLTTLHQIDPLAKSALDTHRDVKSGAIKHPNEEQRKTTNLVDRYLNLPPEAQTVYKELRDHYDDVRDRYINMVQKYGGKAAADKLRQLYQDGKLQVYLPFTRSGDFWVSYVDREGISHEVAFDSPSEREKFMKWAESKGHTQVAPYMRETRTERHEMAPVGLLDDVATAMKANGASQPLLEAVYEAFLDYSSTGSVAQMFRERKGVEGYSQNILGSFAQVAPRMESQVSRIEYADRYAKAMENFQTELQQNVIPQEYPGLQSRYTAAKLPDEYSVLRDYLNNHINTMLNPPKGTMSRVANNITAFNYYMTIALNASTGAVNLLSTPLVSMPMLEAEHGIGKTFTAFERASKIYREGGFDKTEHDLLPDWSFGTNAKGEYKVLHNALMDRGVVSRSLGADLYEMRKVSPSDFNRVTEGAKRTVGFVMQNTERMNREISALASFILKRESGASVREAIDYAVEHVEFVHGAGSIESTAPVFKKPLGKVLFSLRRFTHQTVWQQVRLLQAATAGIPDKSRGLAARQLIAIYAHAGALVGAKGVPLMGMALLGSSILHSMGLWGDEDKPYVPEESLHESTGIFYGGLLDYLTGADISSRASLSNFVWRSDYADLRKSGGLDYFAHNVGGINYSLAKNFYNAGQLASEGEFERAFESVTPASLRNVLQAGRFWKEGAKTIGDEEMRIGPHGRDKIVLTQTDILKRFFGFSPKDVAEYQETHRLLKEDSEQFKDLTNAARRDYLKAIDRLQRAKNPEDAKEYTARAVEASNRFARIHQKNGVVLTSEKMHSFVESYSNKKIRGIYDIAGVKGTVMDYGFRSDHYKRNQ